MAADKNNSRNPNARFTLLKRKAEAEGIPYTSARDAHFRGELPVLKLGRNPNHQRWYVAANDWEQWIESQKQA